MRAWRRFERSDAMRDTLEEIQRAGRLALKPVSSPAPDAETLESDPPDKSQISRGEPEKTSHSGHDSMNSQSATEATP
jgi:hypothetical protein